MRAIFEVQDEPGFANISRNYLSETFSKSITVLQFDQPADWVVDGISESLGDIPNRFHHPLVFCTAGIILSRLLLNDKHWNHHTWRGSLSIEAALILGWWLRRRLFPASGAVISRGQSKLSGSLYDVATSAPSWAGNTLKPKLSRTQWLTPETISTFTVTTHHCPAWSREIPRLLR